ncbi:hypothetical protein Dimus_030391 [Dionaea muscipula]
MSVIHLKKKDIVKSKVRGVDIEFDHEKLTTILSIPGNNGICEYVKDVWEESKYIKPLEITRSGDNRRKDDDDDAPEEEAEKEDEGNKDDFDWEAVIDELLRGNLGQVKVFMMLRMKLKALQICMMRFQQLIHKVQHSRRNKALQESTPRVLSRIRKLNC